MPAVQQHANRAIVDQIPRPIKQLSLGLRRVGSNEVSDEVQHQHDPAHGTDHRKLDDVVSQYERSGLTLTPQGPLNQRDIDGNYCKYPTTKRVVSSVSVLSAFSESISERCKTAVWASASIDVTHMKAASPKSISRSSAL
jgi:hypothetical protein